MLDSVQSIGLVDIEPSQYCEHCAERMRGIGGPPSCDRHPLSPGSDPVLLKEVGDRHIRGSQVNLARRIEILKKALEYETSGSGLIPQGQLHPALLSIADHDSLPESAQAPGFGGYYVRHDAAVGVKSCEGMK